MIHRIGTATLALALLAVPALAETVREQSEVTLDAGPFRELDVENARGQIEVRPGDDDRIHLRAIKVVRAPDAGKAAEIAKLLRVEMSSSGSRKVVRVRYPQRQHVRVGLLDLFRGDVEFPRSEIRLLIEVPARMSVALRSTSGDIATEDLAGTQSLESTSGDVKVEGALGPVVARTTSGNLGGSFRARARLRTASGDIDVDRAEAALDAASTSGDLVVSEAADSLLLGSVSGDIEVGHAARGIRASSTSGNVKVRTVSGLADLETSSGDINVWLGPGLRGARIESGSGNVEARVASGLGLTLEVRTSNGNIDSNLGMQVKSASRRLLTGSLGSGAIPVRLSSSSGDIQILSGGE